MQLGRIQPWQVVLLAGTVRAVLICWAEYQDRHFPVKYTDIDYVVFTDAARFVAAGGSPYQRATYRYSPLLAYLLLPNIWLHPAWGKVLFSVADLAAAGLMHLLLVRGGASRQLCSAALVVWLFNPYTATISTRGSCDVLSVVLLLCLLVCLLYGRPLTSGALYGLAVHFRIYPIIYGPAIALFLMRRSLVMRARQGGNRPYVVVRQRWMPYYHGGGHRGSTASTDDGTAAAAVPVEPEGGSAMGLRQRAKGQDRTDNNVQRLPPLQQPERFNNAAGSENWAAAAAAVLWPVGLFGIAAAATFLLLGVVFYKLYSNTFLQEAFLHHLTRKDPRHNFSPYYYPVYLSYGQVDTTTYGSGRRNAAATAETAANLTSGSGGVAASPLRMMLASWHAVRRVVPVDEPWRMAMVPQAAALLALAVRFHEDLPSAWLLQTWCFVTLNKVVTAQYFVWYLSLLPLVLPALAAQRAVRRTALVVSGAAWVAAQLHWLAWAYQLEMRGRSVHLPLWAACLVFMASNTVSMVLLTRALLWRLRRRGAGSSNHRGIGTGSDASTGLRSEHVENFATLRNRDEDGGSEGVMSFLEASLILACQSTPRPGVISDERQQLERQIREKQ